MQPGTSQQVSGTTPIEHLNTPRLLELDINRMLIGQNQVRYDVNLIRNEVKLSIFNS